MRTIWKYTLNLQESTDAIIEMPFGAKIVHVASQQSGRVSFWVEYDIENRKDLIVRHFQVFGTGQEISAALNNWSLNDLQHIGTTLDGDLVWHLYEWR